MSEYTEGAPQGTTDKHTTSKPKPFGTTVRRIVAGNNDQLDGSIVEESIIPFEDPGYEGLFQACIWKTSETPSNDTNLPMSFDGASRIGDRMGGYVCSMGTNFLIQDFAPGAEVPMNEKHCSHTVEYIFMVYGTMSSFTENGEEFKANAGDMIVRRGNMHSWRNPGPEWARWVAVILDARPATRNGNLIVEGMKENTE